MATIKIEAIDTLFFRDGRPFSMGEETFATGIFPPPPSVLYGALRSAYASENEISLDNIKTETEKIRINGINFNFFDTSYFPLPLDLVKLKSENRNKAKLLRISPKDSFISNLSEDNKFILWRAEHIENITNGMIDTTTFQDYLNGKLKDNWEYETTDELTTTEVKIGIGRTNETKQSEEGKLYRVAMRRMQPLNNENVNKRFSFIVDTNESNLSSFGKLGGEAKGTVMQATTFDNNLNVEYSEDKYFKIYFQTPTFFKNGSVPDLEKYFPNWKLEILTCAVGKSLHIGGFDMADKGGFPKTMMRAIPAGSVFYVKIQDDKTVKQLQEYIKENSIFNLSDYRSEEGFGLFYIANLQFEKLLKNII